MKIVKSSISLAAEEGVEPSLIDPRSIVLPLDDSAIYNGWLREITVFTSVRKFPK